MFTGAIGRLEYDACTCDPQVVTRADVEAFRDGLLEGCHLPEGLTWEDLVRKVKRELPEIWQMKVLET